jgi:DNA invertase Pin-like site-specific DNA recombinase
METVLSGISAHDGRTHACLDRRRSPGDGSAARCVAGGGVDERHLFEDCARGSRDDRAGLAKALVFLKPGDCLVVWKLDHLGRSLSHLLATVNELKDRGVAFRSLTELMDTTAPQGEFLFHVFGQHPISFY